MSTYLVVSVLSMCSQCWLTHGEEEGLTTSHAHDILCCLVDLLLRLGLGRTLCGVAITLLLRSVTLQRREKSQ